MPRSAVGTALDVLRESAHPLAGSTRDYDPLIDLVGDARVVLPR